MNAKRSPDAWHAARAKYQAFIATPIGKAFYDFDNAQIAVCNLGAQCEYASGSDRALQEAMLRETKTRNALMTLLYESAGVGPFVPYGE